MAKSLIPYIRALSCWYICLYSHPQSWSCCRCACIHHSRIVRNFLSLNWSRNEAVCLCRDQLSLVEGKRCPRFPFLELVFLFPFQSSLGMEVIVLCWLDFFRIWTFLEKSPILQHGERGLELLGKLFPLFLPNDIRGHIANAKSVPSHGSSQCSGRSALWVGPHILCLNKVYMNVSENSNLSLTLYLSLSLSINQSINIEHITTEKATIKSWLYL